MLPKHRAPLDLERAPLRGSQAPAKGLHPCFAVVLALNYMMGSGFLTLPKAFVDCSVWVGCLLTVYIAFGATVSAECLLDVMARARRRTEETTSYSEAHGVLSQREVPCSSSSQTTPKQRYAQVSDLVTMYLGKRSGIVYMFMLVGFMMGSLWCYAAIFAASLLAQGGSLFGESTYACYVILYGFVVVPLACRDLADQKNIQTVLAAGRGLMLTVMTLTAGLDLYQNGPLASIEEQPSWRTTISAAPIVAFSCMLHHSVPQISTPVLVADDGNFSCFTLNWIFRCAFALSAVVYVVFGAIVASFFGDQTRSAVNLDWASYRTASASRFSQACGVAISRYIVLYPALNVISVYPLSAVTLGDALHATFYSGRITDETSSFAQSARNEVVAFRFVAATIPLIGALLASDIAAITRYTSIFGLCMCATFPGVLALTAKRINPGPTGHESALNTAGAATCLVIGGSLLSISPFISAVMNAEYEKSIMQPAYSHPQ